MTSYLLYGKSANKTKVNLFHSLFYSIRVGISNFCLTSSSRIELHLKIFFSIQRGISHMGKDLALNNEEVQSFFSK